MNGQRSANNEHEICNERNNDQIYKDIYTSAHRKAAF